MMQNRIMGFHNEHAFLSNFEPCQITYDGQVYPTVEHAYQAAKTYDANARAQIARLPYPGQAKKFGRRVLMRPDWDAVKDQIMLELLRAKFTPGSDLAQKLLETEDAELVEANMWHDNYWGCCMCRKCHAQTGQNMLGRLLTQIRNELRQRAGIQ